MKNFKVVCLVLAMVLSTGLVQASGVMKPKPFINDVLISDNSSLSGLVYSGSPIKGGSDAIGHNVNYIKQVTMLLKSDGSSVVQIYLKSLAPSAYSLGLSSLASLSSAIGLDSVSFQETGIIMPRSIYYNKMASATKMDWSWQIIVSYNLNAVATSSFRTALADWSASRLPFTSNSATTVNYWR